MSFPLDVNNHEQMLKIVMSCIGTKFTSRFGTLMAVGSAISLLWIHRCFLDNR